MNTEMMFTWTPGSHNSEESTQSWAGSFHPLPGHPTSRDTLPLPTPDHSVVSVDSLSDATWSPPGVPLSSAATTALRTSPSESSENLLPRIPGTGRSSVGRTPVPWLRRAASMRFPQTSMFDTSEISTESSEIHSRPSTPCPLPAEDGFLDLLDLARPAELEPVIR